MPIARRNTDALRWALLLALGGPAAVACGQTTDGGSDDGDADSSDDSDADDGGTGGRGQSVTTSCGAPTPLVAGADTGFVVCSEGYTHRTAVVACPSQLPRPEPLPPIDGAGGAGFESQCESDADCPGDHAYCEQAYMGEPAGYLANVCRNGCVADAECGSGSICECGPLVGHCVAATCASDAECGSDSLCVGTTGSNGCSNITVYQCATRNDECLSRADCDANSDGTECLLDANGNRTCQYAGCAIGRPFLIDFLERRAPLEWRSDWLADLEPVELGGLDDAQRGALAAHWAEIGLMEHASIAAFARFGLQLRSLGAPSSLLQATRRAVADETRHAKLCFALATQYGGRAVGPGSLNMTGALNDLSIETILRTTIVEGCVGETQAALEASRASNLCKDPVVARVLATIAADESRHAELAWRFVGWLLREYPEQSQLFHATLAQLRPAASDLRRAGQVQEEPGTTELGRLGMLSSAAQARVRRETWAQVIEPCARALGDQHSTAKFHGDLLVQNASEPGPSGHFQVS